MTKGDNFLEDNEFWEDNQGSTHYT